MELRLKDILEKEVDEKYYLKGLQDFFIKNSFEQERKGNGFRFSPHIKNNADIAKTITTHNGSRMDDNYVIDVDSEDAFFKFDSTNSIAVREATKKGYAEAVDGDSINLEQPNSKTRRGRVGKQQANTLTTSCNQAVVEPFIVASHGRNPENPSDRTAGSPTEQRLESKTDGCTNTLTTVQKDNYVVEPTTTRGSDVAATIRSSIHKQGSRNLIENIKNGRGYEGVIDSDLRIRKLTPLECWRLMGFDDEDFYKAEKVNSNTQLYKQAGNSIVVNVLEAMFDNLKGILYD